MEDRMTLNLIYIGLISACFAIVMTSVAFFSSYLAQAEAALSDQTDLISIALEQSGETADLTQFLGEQNTLQLFAADGTSIYPAENADGPIPLPEILQSGAGSTSGRYTSEDGERRIYSVRTLSNGRVLCVSQVRPEIFQALSGNFIYILIIFLILIPLSILFSLWTTRRMLRPLKDLPRQLSAPSFDPSKLEIYPELVPLVQEIAEQRDEREAVRQEFTANVSHELKTPLTTISGYSEMIANGLAKPEDVSRFAAQIHAESERMQQLVGDIIELNALDSETIHEQNDEVDLLSLAQDCVEQLSPQFSARHLSVFITGEGFSVRGNRRQLWELVYNLLDNARRYNVDGGMIRIFAADGVFSVQDTGVGIPPEHQLRVFERFYRVDKSHSRATGGTGLGLSIVKHVAELHGASLELESQEHIGTTVTVRFPETV